MARFQQDSTQRGFRPACHGRMHYVSGEFLPRHVHEEAFATVVLTGGYVEAGDTGRHRAGPGDVVLHWPYENHLNRVQLRRTEIIVIPLDFRRIPYACGRIADPDSLMRIVESDPASAQLALLEQLRYRAEAPADWPDDLARALQDDPSLRLGDWAREHGLSVGSVSRGFAQVYGISASSYRLLQRAQRAIRYILATDEPLSTIAQHCRFADQAHMCRTVQRVTALSPSRLRTRPRG